MLCHRRAVSLAFSKSASRSPISPAVNPSSRIPPATGMLVAGGIREDGFTAGEIGEREADFEKASDTARRWQSIRPRRPCLRGPSVPDPGYSRSCRCNTFHELLVNVEFLQAGSAKLWATLINFSHAYSLLFCVLGSGGSPSSLRN